MGIEEGYMLTIARLGRLDNLNFSAVTPQERVNAEMYYLSRIAREAAEVPETEEEGLLAKHKRYAELCEAYGTPAINRMTTAVNPNTLEARLINFTFELQSSTDSSEVVTKTQQIPRTFDVYRLKGLVGRLFGVRPLATRLMWKTGEWDPVAGFHEDEYDSENSDNEAANQERSGDKWTRRVVELEDGTKEVGFWIETKVAKVRVELR
ncbi:MAG: hypothetical protein M1832_005194 [Thelocarpon impressellum]|nr:MAG: hypothetical protein M1832_005194 [Thelocarpon impressellum]